MGKCDYSSNGKHEAETSEVTVTKKGITYIVIRKVCRWCGKNMGK